MNNNLSANLKSIRKEHNLSQEQLAEELGVSRQAISKWESGAAYPEMDKIMSICNKFNINIDDLMLGNICEVKNTEASKSSINKYIDSFLNFITDTIEMLGNMSFKSKFKCLAEQLLIAALLFLISLFFGGLGDRLLHSMLYLLPSSAFSLIHGTLGAIFTIIMTGISLCIMVHIFKTRYLNYFLSLKADSVSNNTESAAQDSGETLPPVNDAATEMPDFGSRHKSKVIIRDPEHSEYRFVTGLMRFSLLFVKALALILLIGFCAFQVFTLAGLMLSFLVVKSGMLFAGLLLALLSASVINTVIILLLINFVFNRKSHKKAMVLAFIIPLILLGIGCGIGFAGFMELDYIDGANVPNEFFTTANYELSMTDDLLLYDYPAAECIAKDIDGVEIEFRVRSYCIFNCHDFNGCNSIEIFAYLNDPIRHQGRL